MKASLFLGTSLGLLLLAGTASAATTKLNVTMSGNQEAPPVSTAAGGSGELSYDDATKKLSGMLTMTGLLDATAAHIHKGACGVSGDVVITLSADKAMLMIDETLDAATATDLMAGNLYVNVHTTAAPNGEIRGQLVPEGGKGCGDDPLADGGASSSSGSTSSGGADGGSSSSSGGATSSSGGSNGAVTTRPSDSTTPSSSSGDSGGCSTSGSAPGGAVLAVGVGLALAALARGRRKR